MTSRPLTSFRPMLLASLLFWAVVLYVLIRP